MLFLAFEGSKYRNVKEDAHVYTKTKICDDTNQRKLLALEKKSKNISLSYPPEP